MINQPLTGELIHCWVQSRTIIEMPLSYVKFSYPQEKISLQLGVQVAKTMPSSPTNPTFSVLISILILGPLSLVLLSVGL